MNVKKITQLGLLTAIALIIFVVELRLPNLFPIPGAKLGLANVVTVYAVYHFTAKEAAMILLSRILLGSFFCGNMIALLYSLCGGIMCFIGMILLKRIIDGNYIWICSVIGAILHNIGQIAAAAAVMRTIAVISYLPFLLLSGCIAGAFTGICAQILVKRIKLKNNNY